MLKTKSLGLNFFIPRYLQDNILFYDRVLVSRTNGTGSNLAMYLPDILVIKEIRLNHNTMRRRFAAYT